MRVVAAIVGTATALEQHPRIGVRGIRSRIGVGIASLDSSSEEDRSPSSLY